MKKNEKEKREEAEQLRTACSKVHEKDEKRRDERREDAVEGAFRIRKDYREMPRMPTRSALKSSKGNITDCDLDSAY